MLASIRLISGSGLSGPLLDELEAEPSVHAQATVADVMVERGGHLDDPVS